MGCRELKKKKKKLVRKVGNLCCFHKVSRVKIINIHFSIAVIVDVMLNILIGLHFLMLVILHAQITSNIFFPVPEKCLLKC